MATGDAIVYSSGGGTNVGGITNETTNCTLLSDSGEFELAVEIEVIDELFTEIGIQDKVE